MPGTKPSDDFRIHAHHLRGDAVLELSGRVDAHAHSRLVSKAVEEAHAGAHRIVVDLDAVRTIDSSALAWLVELNRPLHERRVGLAFVTHDHDVKLLFERAGITRFAPVFDTQLAAFGRRPMQRSA
jgi:anti-anti-sigma factor